MLAHSSKYVLGDSVWIVRRPSWPCRRPLLVQVSKHRMVQVSRCRTFSASSIGGLGGPFNVQLGGRQTHVVLIIEWSVDGLHILGINVIFPRLGRLPAVHIDRRLRMAEGSGDAFHIVFMIIIS